ncbi:NlpC/P60 family protein [Selenomonadales bacterium OttesenSCG-928-I06]|nr:NlpC/P60 family protein [Selenomonadales bacterium OttesenSCG-928-I06]
MAGKTRKFKQIIRLFLVLFVFISCIGLTLGVNAEEGNYYQFGDIGSDVEDIQRNLNALGCDVGAADGVFGSKTKAGVEAFQSKNELEVTGIVDAVTYKLILKRDIPQVSRDSYQARARRVIQTSMNYIGVPYVFGGTSPSGFDCSGFTRFVFARVGIDLPRMADSQYEYGYKVPRDSLRPGDLVFFTTYTYGVSHSGIYIGEGRFISATSSRGIKIDSLSDGYWGPRYVGACRVL